MKQIKPSILSGKWIDLEPFSDNHREELRAVAQDEKIWSHSSSKAFGHHFDKWFDKAMKTLYHNQSLPYIVRLKIDNTILGSTRYYDMVPEHKRLSIGYTWYVPKVWGSYVNPECKLLLLQQAFETFQVNRVELFTDARNSRSRAAIKKIGAMEEGMLRQHMVLEDGHIRDTVVFSIIQSEWPQTKEKLQTRLKTFK